MNKSWGLELHFKEMAENSGNDAAKILWDSWCLEKRQLHKRLNAASNNYPNYSLHDASHSVCVISNIELILGKDRIEQLSYSNIWLILQCAYTHDIGMTMPSVKIFAEKIASLSEIEFERFQQSMETESLESFEAFRYLSPLFKYYRSRNKKNTAESETEKSVLLKKKITHDTSNQMDAEQLDSILNDRNTDWPLKFIQSFTKLSETYNRKKHHEYSAEILEDEAEEKSYRGLIPLRLRLIVAAISKMHGLDKKEMLTLPKETLGLGNDYINPCFVASLLRVGDALDIDSNRFLREQLESIGNESYSSFLHQLKHESISDFLVSPTLINISADFKTEKAKQKLRNSLHSMPTEQDTALNSLEHEAHELCIRACKILLGWVDIIRNELAFLNEYWSVFVPQNFPGLCPRVGNMFTKIDGKEIDEDELNLQYQIDTKRSAELIEGVGLYQNGDMVFIRELLQNATDTTKVQIFKDLKSGALQFGDIENINNLSPLCFYAQIKQHLTQYMITVTVKPDVKENVIIISIQDRGTGISLSKLKRMRHIGNIFDPELEKLKDEMPEWLRPTGDFGIGMQSVFLLASSFEILTCAREELDSYNKPIYRKLRFYSTRMGGEIFSTFMQPSEKKSFNTKYGTKVIVKIPLKSKLVESILLSQEKLYIDPVRAITQTIRDYIENNCLFLGIPIMFNDGFKQEIINETYATTNFLLSQNSEALHLVSEKEEDNYQSFWAWNSAMGVLIRYEKRRPDMIKNEGSKPKVRLFFKEIKVSDLVLEYKIDIPFWDIDIHIMGASARAVLDVSRDYFRIEKHQHIVEMVHLSHICFMLKLFKESFVKEHYNQMIKLFISQSDTAEIEYYYYAMQITWRIFSKTQKRNELFAMDKIFKIAKIQSNININFALLNRDTLAVEEIRLNRRHDIKQADWFMSRLDMQRYNGVHKLIPHADYVYMGDIDADMYYGYIDLAITHLLPIYINRIDKTSPVMAYKLGKRTGAAMSMSAESYWAYVKHSIDFESEDNFRIILPGCGMFSELELAFLPEECYRIDRYIKTGVLKYNSYMISPLTTDELRCFLKEEDVNKALKSPVVNLSFYENIYIEPFFQFVAENSSAGRLESCIVKIDVDVIKERYLLWLRFLHNYYYSGSIDDEK